MNAAGGQHGRGVIGGLRPGRQADRRRADRLGHVGQHRRQLVVALDGDRRAVERRDRPFRVGEGDERMEGAGLGPGRHRRGEDLRPERAAGVDHRLAAVHPERAGQRRHDVVGDGQDDQLDLVEDRLRVGEDAGDIDQRAEPLAPARVAAGDRVDRPAGARQRDAQCRPDRAGADDADDRRLAGPGMDVGMGVVGRVGLVGVAVRARRRRIEVDARPPRWRLPSPRDPPPCRARGRRRAGRPRPSSSVVRGHRPISTRTASIECSEQVRPDGRPPPDRRILVANFDPGWAHPPGAD